MIHVVSYSIYHSANSYLGVILAGRALQGLPVRLERRPLAIPKSRGLKVADLVGGHEGPDRGAYHREDCARWAAKFGIELRFSPPEVFAERAARWRQSPLGREELPARAYYGAIGSGREAQLDQALFRASYIDGLDVNEESVVRQAATLAGLDPEQTIRRAMDADTKRRLDEALAAFDRDACPGVPTWVVKRERFWGKDRVDWLAEAVARMTLEEENNSPQMNADERGSDSDSVGGTFTLRRRR